MLSSLVLLREDQTVQQGADRGELLDAAFACDAQSLIVVGACADDVASHEVEIAEIVENTGELCPVAQPEEEGTTETVALDRTAELAFLMREHAEVQMTEREVREVAALGRFVDSES